VLLRVLELSPDNAKAYLLIAASYDYLGDTEASIRANLKSIELEPTRAGYRDLGLTFYYSGDFERALAAFQRAVELGEEDHAAWGNLAMTYRQLGDEGEARAAFEKAIILAADLVERNPRDWLTMAGLAVYNVMVGDTATGLQRIRMAASEGSHVPDVHYFDAVIQMKLGRSEEAMDALERAIDLGTPERMISTDPEFESLENDARYKKLVDKQTEE
jgi:Flp pilus assembly protein TadD